MLCGDAGWGLLQGLGVEVFQEEKGVGSGFHYFTSSPAASRAAVQAAVLVG